jgi:hypothetical protein
MSSDTASRGSVVISASIVHTVLALLAISLRLISRTVFLKNTGRGEAAIVVSMVDQILRFLSVNLIRSSVAQLDCLSQAVFVGLLV